MKSKKIIIAGIICILWTFLFTLFLSLYDNSIIWGFKAALNNGLTVLVFFSYLTLTYKK